MKKYFLSLICILLVVFSFTNVFAASILDYWEDDYFETEFFNDDFFETDVHHSNEKNIIMFDDEINISGPANDLTILLGNRINSNTIGSHAFLVGQSLLLGGSTTKDAFLVGNSVDISSHIGRDVYACGKTVTISGAVEGNLYVVANKLVINSSGFVQGNIYANGVQQIIVSDGAVVNGTINYDGDAYTDIPSRFKTLVTDIDIDEDFSRPSIDFEATKLISSLVTRLVTFSIVLLLFPLLFAGITSKYEMSNQKHLFKTFGIGLLVLILPLIITTILLLTLVGIPMAFIIFLAYIILLLLAKVTAGFTFTRVAFNGKIKNNWLAGFIGISILEIIYLIPLVGGFIEFVALVFGLGLLFEVIAKRTPKKLVDAPVATNESIIDKNVAENKSNDSAEEVKIEDKLSAEEPIKIVEDTEVKEPDVIITETPEKNTDNQTDENNKE